MGEYASWHDIGEMFGGLSKLDHFTDGGKGYGPRADYHIKWHADKDGVVDRFHITRESDRTHVYYLLDRGRPPALTTHAGGPVQAGYYRGRGVGLDPFDALADAYIDRVLPTMTRSYAAARGTEDDFRAKAGAAKAKQADAGAFLARRGAAFTKAKDRGLTSLAVTVGAALKTIDPKSTLLGMKAPYGDHEEMLAAIEAALDAGPVVTTPAEKLVESGITNTASVPTNPPAPTGMQIVHHGPPGHWEVKPLATATTSRPPGL